VRVGLKGIVNMNYKQKLLDPRWQKKRLSIFERDSWKCKICQSSEETLHVHHVFYEQHLDPWEYPDYALITLCSECHETEHEAMKDTILSLRHTMASVGILTSDDVSYLQYVISENFKNGVFYGQD
jgi:hypothetical protein